jgi:hypothetical protein
VTNKTRTTRSLLGAVVAFVIVSTGALVAASPASAGGRVAHTTRVTFGVQPATAGRPDSRANLSYGVTPGSTVRDHVAIVNFSAARLTLTVYATDARNTSDGGFGLLDGGQQPKDAGAWTSLGGRPAGAAVTVHVPARRSAGPGFVLLPLVLHVPAGTGPGDHVGGVVAVLSTIGTNSQGTKVRLDQRVATRLFARVSGRSSPRLAVEDLSATYHPRGATLASGTVTVAYTVHNTGNVSLGAHQSVRLSGVLGAAGNAPEVADVPLLLPGASARESVDVPGVLPLVRLSATTTLRPTGVAGALAPGVAGRIVAGTSFWALPWAFFVLLVLVAAALGLWWRRRRRASAGRAGIQVARPMSPVGEPQGVSS